MIKTQDPDEPKEVQESAIPQDPEREIPENEKHNPLTETDYERETLPVPEIPSQFSLYGSDGIFVRGLTVGEIKSISTSSEYTWAQIASLFKEVITGVPILDMIPVDLKSLVFLSAYYTDPQHKVHIKTPCPRCNHTNVRSLTLVDVEYEDLEKSEQPLEVTQRDGKIELLNFRTLTIRDEIFLERLVTLTDKYDIELARYALMLNPNISETDDKALFDRKYKLVNEAPGRYLKEYKTISRMITPDIKPLQASCQECDFRVFSSFRFRIAALFAI